MVPQPQAVSSLLSHFSETVWLLLHLVILDLGGKGLVHLVKLEILGCEFTMLSDDPDDQQVEKLSQNVLKNHRKINPAETLNQATPQLQQISTKGMLIYQAP